MRHSHNQTLYHKGIKAQRKQEGRAFQKPLCLCVLVVSGKRSDAEKQMPASWRHDGRTRLTGRHLIYHEDTSFALQPIKGGSSML
jgi:hypothetical protein